MATTTRKKQSTQSRKKGSGNGEISAQSFDPRILVPVAGAALAVLAPAVALGGRAMRERQESEARARVIPGLPIGGAVLAVAGALAWQNRDLLVRKGGEAATAAKGLVSRVSDQVHGISNDMDDDELDAAAGALSASASPSGYDAFITHHERETADSGATMQPA